MVDCVAVHAYFVEECELLDLLVLGFEVGEGAGEHSGYFGLLGVGVEVEAVYFGSQGIDLFLGEGKDNTRQQFFLIAVVDQILKKTMLFLTVDSLHIGFGDVLDELIHCVFVHHLDPLLSPGIVVEPPLLYLLLLELLKCLVPVDGVIARQFDLLRQLVELLLEEPAIGLLNDMELVEDVERVLQGHGPVEGLHDIDYPVLGPADPVGEVHVVGHGGTQHDDADVLGQHDDGLLPDHASLLVVDVVHLVEDHPLDVPDHLRAPVQVVPQDLRSHDHAARLLVHAHVASDDPHILGPEFQG